MIRLEDNSLSFAFPEIPRQLESFLEQHIGKIRPQFVLPEDRYDLVQMLDQFILHGAMWALVRNTSTAKVVKTAEALTDADVEAALRETAKSIAQLDKGQKGKPITPKKIIQYGNTRRPPRRVIREMPGFQRPPDPVEFLKAPVIQFSEEERTALIKKMKRSRKAIADSFQHPLDALLACLHFHADWDLSGSTQKADGSTKDLILVFMSPPDTWRMRAGRGGFYTVDPRTLRARSFKMTVLN